jgi:malonyl CoA-acyl carrier protein transacylase
VIDIANINSRQQFVLAGTKAALEALAPALQEVGAIVMALKVSGAFHSRYMRPAAQSLAEVLDKTPLARQQIPVISNVTAKPHQDGHIVDRLVEQLYSPVRWLQSVEYLLRDGECEFHEIGVGQTLTGLLRYIQKGM